MGHSTFMLGVRLKTGVKIATQRTAELCGLQKHSEDWKIMALSTFKGVLLNYFSYVLLCSMVRLLMFRNIHHIYSWYKCRESSAAKPRSSTYFPLDPLISTWFLLYLLGLRPPLEHYMQIYMFCTRTIYLILAHSTCAEIFAQIRSINAQNPIVCCKLNNIISEVSKLHQMLAVSLALCFVLILTHAKILHQPVL